jgi:hypothetical protein
MALPGLDRNAYEEPMRAEFERALREVANLLDNSKRRKELRVPENLAAHGS